MTELHFIPLNSRPYEAKELIGTLLFAEMPTTIIYKDATAIPIVMEWVDCSNDGSVDRFLIFRSTPYLLKQFIEGHLSHLEFIERNEDSFYVLEDVENSKVINRSLTFFKDIPQSYKPAENFFLRKSDAVDLNLIIDAFNLSEDLQPAGILDKVKELSTAKNRETFNLHLQRGIGVGFGTIITETLGRTLLSFDGFYKNVALDYLKGKNRGRYRRSKEGRNPMASLISTEVYTSIAASYSILIKPAASLNTMLTESSTSEGIVNSIFKLLQNSSESESLTNDFGNHSDYVIVAYKEFLASIIDLRLKFDFQWFNPHSKQVLEFAMDFHKADSIIRRYEALSADSHEEFEVIGRFRAYSCLNAKFAFMNKDGDYFSGYMDSNLYEFAETITFTTDYQIRISRSISMRPGNKKATIKDIVVAIAAISNSNSLFLS